MRFWPFSSKKITPVIRSFEKNRLGDAARLHSRFFAHSWTVSDFSELVGDRQVLADSIFDGTGKKFLGFAISRAVAPEAELLSIAIDPQFQGKGLGRELLRAHFARLAAQGAREVFLEVEQSNSSAIRLYEQFGFTKVGERSGYYEKKDGTRATALVLRVRLD